MSEFDDFFEKFSYNPESFKEDEFKVAAKAAYDADMASARAATAAKDAEIAARDARIQKMGSDLWDLQMKQGPKVPPPGEGGNPNPAGDTATPRTIQSFFKKIG